MPMVNMPTGQHANWSTCQLVNRPTGHNYKEHRWILELQKIAWRTMTTCATWRHTQTYQSLTHGMQNDWSNLKTGTI